MPLKLGEKCEPDLKSYIYLMIETLLPDCLAVKQKRKNDFAYKMLELWADKGQYRRGWISVVQEWYQMNELLKDITKKDWLAYNQMNSFFKLLLFYMIWMPYN